MAHLTNDEFFIKLSELFSASKGKDHGQICLTQKRLSHEANQAAASDETAFADLHPEKPLPILIRARNGKGKEHRDEKIKISTIVDPDDLDGFYSRYAEVCKAGMTALKPRDRTKRKAKAKKKKGAP